MEIIIRGSEPEDAQSYQRIYSDPTVYANTLQLPYPSVAHWRNKRKAAFRNGHYCDVMLMAKLK
ncbi:hypothetical protein GCM10022405_21130 [Gibbsiella dentisursi]|uniref:Acetyltransferase n=1 Tax=Gibbsiella dentisursi TaxID=796890 RepID=A0ABP7L5T2_9GAMM